ncbi:succinylglutamate desuccinylase/aspartoacylase family protein [Arenimonas terrae]|uniref:Succinylglutamate desuccinylase/aspartoacylase family protein n=1 Tax=Arenimonas terrae TaxID=2546226 RepID=A0A5C4RVA9_9GAMM|nr:succinylglutamate desuccinylase/aspartoacylase family protein [Arenimonas terrae]TNJ35263.1 succinylglutamate desuccinylase/aspartoacylase family protein [Arenimonas terrae]
MRNLFGGLMRTRALALALSLAAASAAAQDFPVDPPGGEPTPPTTPPAGIALPEMLPPAPELVTPLAILDRLVVPGTRLQLEWRPAGGISNAEIASPVVVARGAMAGPVLCLVAGIHGDEINGVEIVRRIAHSVDPTRLSGTVIGVPIVNVFGYSRGSRYLPDRRDLNRSFPGSRHGSIASRIANGFFQDIVRHCDVLVDFHTGSFDRSNLPQVRADLTQPDVLEFTRGFGATVVLHSPGNRGMLRTAATAVGIPSVTFEAGAPTRLEPAEIAQAVAAIDRLMLKLGMRQAEADVVEINAVPLAAQAEPAPIFLDSRWVRANSGGLLISEVALGQRVVAGQRLGRVVDPVSNIERYILAPVPGRVIGMSQNQAVLPGYAAFHLGTETSEQQAVQEAAMPHAPEPVAEDPEERPEAAEVEDGEDYE